MKRIQSFAVKWLKKFRNPNTHYIELVDHYMADDCATLGFEMDSGESFVEKYGESSYGNAEELRNIIDRVTDIPILGAAIYSAWRYYNHWAYDAAEILHCENREWFIIALNRLRELALAENRLFKGAPKKIRLVSNNIVYGPAPAPTDEVEQRITLNAAGRVWFSSYNYGFGKLKKNRSKIFKIDKTAATQILANIASYFGTEQDYYEFCNDCGEWNLEITNTEGTTYIYQGSPKCIPAADNTDLSDMIRNALGLDNLHIFDGAPPSRTHEE